MFQTTKETKRLYFNKWIYKICLHLEGMSYIKRTSLKNLMLLDYSPVTNGWYFRQKQLAVNNKDELIKIALFLEDSKEHYSFQTRTEGPTLGIFTNDLSLIDKVNSEFGPLVTDVYQPLNDDVAKYLISNKNKIICTELPSGLYQFKTYFTSSQKIPASTRTNFLAWADNYSDEKISMPKSTRIFLEGSNGYYSYGQYFYTSDSKMLAMALMFISGYASKTDEYVLKTDII